ncbi:twin-arginine translocase subunit TatC [Salinigranum sp. GCM10025319]|uniref:twin-arginine translocase subunit TatC n=1 Tax=Salinigranum sp. GCM10025319 TaxID=3252687 RepID=UPI00361B79AC
MSSALDEDTRQSIARGRETAGAMLRSAQKDMQKVFIVFLVGFLGTFYALRLYVWDFFKGITEAKMNSLTAESVEIIAQTPFDVILLQAKIGLVVGVIFAIPPFLYFSRDALRSRGLWPSSPIPVWKLVVLLTAMVVLFVLGVAYGYLVFFPFTFAFLANNAISAGFAPTYSIVKWAQFIFLLTISFGFATQLPLVMTALSYTEIVPYETFRDKWRHAIAGIFLAGALFTPPDPFTQVLWATPVIALYGFSLYLARIVTTARRGSDRLDLPRTLRTRWNLLAGVAVLGGAIVYVFFTYGGVPAANGLLASVGSDYRAAVPDETLLYAYVAAAGLLGAVLAAMYVVYVDIVALARSATPGTVGDPADIDLGELDASGVRAAPPEAFAKLEENEALRLSSEAMQEGDKEKARAILDRFDAAEAERDEDEDESGDDVVDRTERATGTFLSELTEGEKDEDDVGGYYDEVVFVLDSITSKSFRIAIVFAITLASVFGWLYTGGIGDVFDQFLSQLPAQVTPDENITVVALHPMEALIFEVKFSTLIAVLVTLPVVAYYAWPALRERNIVRHRRRAVFGWAGALTAGLLGGFALGYGYVAPTIISFLVADAVQSNMIIAYRITNFFWLIFFTTAGIGLLADIPVLMLLLNTTGISYRTMRSRWREVTVGILAFAALFTPADIMTMFLVTIPLMVAYGVGLGVLFVITLGGRRNLAPPRTADV